MAWTFRVQNGASAGAGSGSPVTIVTTGIQNGDLMVAFINDTSAVAGASVSAPTPTGWTQIASISKSYEVTRVYMKIAASEPASYSWVVASGVGSAATGAIAAWYDPAHSTTPALDLISSAQDSGVNHSTPSITTTKANALLVALFGLARSSGNNWTPPAGMTERVDRQVANHASIEIADVVQVTIGATGVKTAVSSQSKGSHNYLAAFYYPDEPSGGGSTNPSLPNLPREGPIVAPDSLAFTEILAGVEGPTRVRYRYEQRDKYNRFKADITDAVISGDLELDNERATLRTVHLTVNKDRLPQPFDLKNDCVAIWYDVWDTTASAFIPSQLGLFKLAKPKRTIDEAGEMWDVDGADLCDNLANSWLDAPYFIPAGSRYTDQLKILVGLGELFDDIAPADDTTPIDYTFAPGTALINMINDLAYGINYWPVWAAVDGRITGRRRRFVQFRPTVGSSGFTDDPLYVSLQQPDVQWSADEDPKMIMPPIQKEDDPTSRANIMRFITNDPTRTINTADATNIDPLSPSSTRNSPTKLQQIDADYVANFWVDYPTPRGVTYFTSALVSPLVDLILEEAHAQDATMLTLYDPRRDAHETYRITIPDQEDNTRWYCFGWHASLAVDAVMEHKIGKMTDPLQHLYNAFAVL